jgi:hypothetical protein
MGQAGRHSFAWSWPAQGRIDQAQAAANDIDGWIGIGAGMAGYAGALEGRGVNLLLSRDERQRFAEYCKRESETLEGMAKQMDQIKTIPQMIQRERNLALAYALVAHHLSNVQDESI